MRRYLVIVLMLAAACTEEDVSRLYVICGQSNAVGGASVVDLADPAMDDTYPAVQIHRYVGVASDDPFVWTETALASLAPRGTKHGFELSLGRGLDAKYGAGRVVILQVAVSGTSISDWLTTGTVLAEQATNLNAQLVAYVAAEESAGASRLEGVVWSQGNGDVNAQATAEAYASRLRLLGAGLRASLPGRDFRFVYDQLPDGVAGTYTSTVRSQQATVSEDPGYTMIKTDSLKLRDSDHYDSLSFVELGYAFAEAL